MKLLHLLLTIILLLSNQPLVAYSPEDSAAPFKDPQTENSSVLSTLEFQLDNTFASRYWGSIVGGIFYPGGAVNFTDLTVTRKDDLGSFNLLIGMINPLDTLEYDDQGGTEYYLGIGRSFDLWKDGSDIPLINLNIFFMYDALSNIGHFDDDVIQGKLSLSLPRVPFVTPYAEFYNWEKSGSDSPAVGWFARAGFKHQLPLGFKINGEELKLGTDLSVGYSGPGLFGTSSGLAYYRAVVGTQIKVSENFTLSPSIIGQLPGNQNPDTAFVDDKELFYNLTLTWKF